MISRVIMPIVLAFCVCGCSRFVVRVDSITDPAQPEKSLYYIFPGMQGVSPNDLHFKEYTSYLSQAFQSRGFREVEPDSAQLIIFVAYGIGDPRTVSFQYSVPVFGRTDPGATTITGTTYGATGTSTTFATVTPKRRYGVVGTQTYSGTSTTYFRFLILDAIDYEAFKIDSTLRVLWNTTVTSEGSSGDLREVMPALVAGSAKYIGTNTGKQIEIQLLENDPAITKLRSQTTK